MLTTTLIHLVVEKSRTLFDESDPQVLGGVKDSTVVLRTGRRGDVFHTASGCSINVVDEWELISVSKLISHHVRDCRGLHPQSILTKASLDTATSPSLSNHSRLSSGENGFGTDPSAKLRS